jgi:hypothetical protein
MVQNRLYNRQEECLNSLLQTGFGGLLKGISHVYSLFLQNILIYGNFFIDRLVLVRQTIFAIG